MARAEVASREYEEPIAEKGQMPSRGAYWTVGRDQRVYTEAGMAGEALH